MICSYICPEDSGKFIESICHIVTKATKPLQLWPLWRYQVWLPCSGERYSTSAAEERSYCKLANLHLQLSCHCLSSHSRPQSPAATQNRFLAKPVTRKTWEDQQSLKKRSVEWCISAMTDCPGAFGSSAMYCSTCALCSWVMNQVSQPNYHI